MSPAAGRGDSRRRDDFEGMATRARPAGTRMAVERMHACFQTPAVVARHAAAVRPPGTRSSHCSQEHEHTERGG